MGIRGPKPKPGAVLKLTGSRRAGGRDESRPVADGRTPKCPPWLTDDAKKFWFKTVRMLKELGILSSSDAGAIGRYCMYSVLWTREMQNPARSELTLNKYANQLCRLEQALGLNPSARAGLKIEPLPQPENDPFERLKK